MADKLTGRLSKTSETLYGRLSNKTLSLRGSISNKGFIADHRLLEHRDADDQHPISAITGLSEITESLINGFELYCGTSTEVI